MLKPVILVVDDSDDDLALLRRELNKRYGEDYEVIAESQPQQALQTLKGLVDNRQDVVIFLADQWLEEIEGIFLLGQVQGICHTAKRILMILHQEMSTPGRIGYLLKNAGYELDIRRPRFDDPLPATMRDHAGAIVFGGPMSANDGDDYIRREIDWIGVPLAENKPFLGLCLGAQMLARHLGKRVYRHPEGRVEIGYHAIAPRKMREARGTRTWATLERGKATERGKCRST
jgi:aromatic ring-cleaving dioxygenase